MYTEGEIQHCARGRLVTRVWESLARGWTCQCTILLPLHSSPWPLRTHSDLLVAAEVDRAPGVVSDLRTWAALR